MATPKVNKVIKTDILKFAKQAGIESAPLIESFKETLVSDRIKALPTGDRQAAAWRMTRALAMKSAAVQTVPYKIQVLRLGEVRTITKDDGSVLKVFDAFALAMKEGKKGVKLARINGFDEDTSVAASLEEGAFFDIKLAEKGVNGKVLSLSFVSGNNGAKLEKEASLLGTIKQLQKRFDRTMVIDISANVSEDKGDIKLFIADLIEVDTFKAKASKRRFGIMKAIDESVSFEDVVAGGGFTMFADPSELKWDIGSNILVLGTVEEDERDGEIRYSVRTDLILPIVAVDREIVSVDDQSQLDGITNDDEELDAATEDEVVEDDDVVEDDEVPDDDEDEDDDFFD